MSGMLTLLLSGLSMTGAVQPQDPDDASGIFLPITNPQFYYGEISSVRRTEGHVLTTDLLVFDVHARDIGTAGARTGRYGVTADCDNGTFEISASSLLDDQTAKPSTDKSPLLGRMEHRHVEYVIDHLCADLILTGGDVVSTEHTFEDVEEFVRRSVQAAALEVTR